MILIHDLVIIVFLLLVIILKLISDLKK